MDNMCAVCTCMCICVSRVCCLHAGRPEGWCWVTSSTALHYVPGLSHWTPSSPLRLATCFGDPASAPQYWGYRNSPCPPYLQLFWSLNSQSHTCRGRKDFVHGTIFPALHIKKPGHQLLFKECASSANKHMETSRASFSFSFKKRAVPQTCVLLTKSILMRG